MVENLPAMQETEFDPWEGKIRRRREWQPTPVFLPGESHGQRGLAHYSHGVAKSRTRLSKLTVVYNVGFIYLFFFNFWPHPVACGISVL